MDYPIRKIEGIGKVNEAKLGTVGIKTTGDLLEKCRAPADREKVAAEAGIGAASLLSWARRADLMRIKEVGEEFSDVLAAAGTGSVKELAAANAEELRAALDDVIKKKRLVRQLPSVKVTKKWIEEAKKMMAATAGDAEGVVAEEKSVEGEEPGEYEPGDAYTEKCAETWFRKLEPFVRNNYFLGKLMTARDMKAEQEYVRRHFALGRRTIAGSGIVCGLGVQNVSLDDSTLTFEVGPGLAVDPFGRFIVVGPPKEPEEAAEGLPECESAEGPERSIDISGILEKTEGESVTLHLYIYYDEDEYEQVPTFKRDEPCEEDLMPNRVRETYGFTVSDKERGEVETSPQDVETGCPEPTDKCVLLAELIGKKDGGKWRFEIENAERAIYSNVELYDLIMENLGGREGVVKKINDAVPDGEGKIALSEGAGIGIAGVGEHGLSVSLADADKYVKWLSVVDGDAAGATNNKVRFEGKEGIKVTTLEKDGVKDGLAFALEEAIGKPEFKVVAGAVEVTMKTLKGQNDSFGNTSLPKNRHPLPKGRVVAFHVGYSLRERSATSYCYFGDRAVIPAEFKGEVELAGYAEVDKEGIMQKLHVYLHSPTKKEKVWVHYWIVEEIGGNV